MTTISFWLEMDSLGEVELSVTYRFDKGRPARNYLRNGDPGYPADPDEIYILKVMTKDGIDLTALLGDSLADYQPFINQVYDIELEAA